MSYYRMRWSDNDRCFGPLLFSRRQRSGFRGTGLVLESNPGDQGRARCFVRGHVAGHTLIIHLPVFLKPYRERVPTARGTGTQYRIEESSREFGITVNDGFLQVFFGRQTDDSTTTRSWSAFLPWTETRLVRHGLLDTQGNETEFDDALLTDGPYIQAFTFGDTDGNIVQARTYLHTLEYRRGTGWCKWLGYVTRALPIRRILNIEYSAEVGDGKHEWKGGVLGCSIDAHPGELHAAAFLRHCETQGLVYPLPSE